MAKEIQDFSDLAEETQFIFEGETYSIKPINGPTAKDFFRKSAELEKQRKKEERERLKAEEAGEDYDYENDTDFIDFQANLISSVLVWSVDKKAVPKENIVKWPIKVQRKVFNLIQEEIMGLEENTEPEKK